MGIGDSITIVGCLAGTMLALPALLVSLSLLMNRATSRAAACLQQGVIRPLLVGVMAVVVIAVPASILISMGSVFQLVGVLIYLFLLTWGFTGMAAFTRMLGERLGLMADEPRSSMTETLIGASVLSFAVAFPLVGWLVILPASFVMGIGATLIGRKPAVEATA